MTQLGLSDRARIAWTVWIVSLPLLDLPRRRRRPILRDLHANLREAAAEVGSREAVARLGSKVELANSYLVAAGPRSRLVCGVLWMVLAFACWMFAYMLISTGFLMGVEMAAPTGDYRYSWQAPWLLGFGGFLESTGDGTSVGGTLTPGPLIIFAVAFGLGASRFWRKLPFTGRAHRETPVSSS